MALKEFPKGASPLRTNHAGSPYMYQFAFDTNTSSAADGLTVGALTAGAPASGVHTFTFDPNTRPRSVSWSNCKTSAIGEVAKVTNYVASTGVLSITVFLEDGTSGVTAADASNTSNNTTVQVILFCNSSAIGD